MLKNQVMHKVIHIIQMEKHVDELIYIMGIETNVLVIVMKMKNSTEIGKKVLTFKKSKYYRIFAKNITIRDKKHKMSDKINCSLQGIFCLKLRKTIEKLQ